METYALLLAATLNAGTVLAVAALGLLINEKVGVVNLGAEGMMLMAAVVGFAVGFHTGNPWLAFAAGAVAGICGPRNPVLAARAVMDKTDHVLLIGRAYRLGWSADGLGAAAINKRGYAAVDVTLVIDGELPC
jgi:ABC-type uncharacterized transport system permease subunit